MKIVAATLFLQISAFRDGKSLSWFHYNFQWYCCCFYHYRYCYCCCYCLSFVYHSQFSSCSNIIIRINSTTKCMYECVVYLQTSLISIMVCWSFRNRQQQQIQTKKRKEKDAKGHCFIYICLYIHICVYLNKYVLYLVYQSYSPVLEGY